MRILLPCLAIAFATTVAAAPVQLVQQGRLLDPTGAPVNGTVDLTLSLCPNAAPTGGESCYSETFSQMDVQDGYFAVILGDETPLDHTVFDVPALWVAFSIDGGGSELSSRQRMSSFAPHTGMVYLGGPSGACENGANEGAIVYSEGNLMFCDGVDWRTVSTTLSIVATGGVRTWSDGAVALSCEDYIRPADSNRIFIGEAVSGAYRIDPDATGPIAPFDVYCDMETQDGGWTMVLNLDTSDGHVMWWGAGEWTNTGTYGTVDNTPFSNDLKTQAYSDLTGTSDVLLVAHEQGITQGWKQFTKANGNSLHWYMSQGDNTLLGTEVVASDVSGMWSQERLVRLSTTLVANRCYQHNGGSCTGNNASSPDGDRISSNEATGYAGDNTGGGLGNWHDMNYCCGSSLAGHSCNGHSIRTASEAQAGWSYDTQFGTFGTDSLLPMNGAKNNNDCSNANWAIQNGRNLDYALYVR